MAQGDITIFEEANLDFFQAKHDLTTTTGDTIKVGIIDNTSGEPAAATATPTWGDFSADEVTDAGSYTAGGTALPNSLTELNGTVTFTSSTNPSWTADPSNATDARWGIIYNDSDTTGPDAALGYIDLGTSINMVTGSLTITWSGSGIFTVAFA